MTISKKGVNIITLLGVDLVMFFENVRRRLFKIREIQKRRVLENILNFVYNRIHTYNWELR